MLNLLISILGIIFTILFVIGTHESAHFFTARLLGVKVLRFSIGFGKTLLRWHDNAGTEYVFALIPLGGYVKMLDENEEPVAANQLAYAYNRQPFYKKFLIVLAGPAMNLLCALVLYWFIFVFGFTAVKPIIGSVAPQSIAAVSGLSANEQIVSVDKQLTHTWVNIVFRLLAHAGDADHVSMQVLNLTNQKTRSLTLDLSGWRLNDLNPDPLQSLGITPYELPVPLIIGEIKPHSPAATNLQIGDKITSINHHAMSSWDELIPFIIAHPSQTVTVGIERHHKTLLLPLTIGEQRSWLFKKSGYLGIAPHIDVPKYLLHEIKYGPIAAIGRAWQEMIDLTYFNLLIFGKIFAGKISVQSMGGPITIFESAGAALNYGFLAFISFLAFLSVAIGVINLFPIPGLDGGHLLFQLIEAVIGRPIPEKILIFLYKMGFLLIFLVFSLALWNDIKRMF